MENKANPVLIDGRIVAKTIKEEIKQEVENLLAEGKRPPHLVAVIVGNDGASLSYVASKPHKKTLPNSRASSYAEPQISSCIPSNVP